MSYSAKILKDSISPDGVRLTTMEVTFPRIVLAEFNTHRVFSRNSASSRAIPVEKMIKRIQDDPFIPSYWGKNQKGMQAESEISEPEKKLAAQIWTESRDNAINSVKKLLDIGVHKQITNRLLEPFMWHTVIVTATEWSNFFHLRDNKDAQPEIREVASLMKEVYNHPKNEPDYINYGNWHLPLIDREDYDLAAIKDTSGKYDFNTLIKISSGRCARVSYLTHDGKRDHKADIELHDRLLEGGHMSPFEHVARPIGLTDLTELEYGTSRIRDKFVGNFKGWVQYRKTITGESDILSS